MAGFGTGRVQIERIPTRQQSSRSRNPKAAPERPSSVSRLDLRDVDGVLLLDRCRTSCNHCRCGDRCRRTSGCRSVTIASAPIANCRCCFHHDSSRRFFLRADIRPACTPKTLSLNAPVSLSFKPVRAAILALVVALDAVVRLIERAAQIHATVGQREAVAMPVMVFRQTCLSRRRR